MSDPKPEPTKIDIEDAPVVDDAVIIEDAVIVEDAVVVEANTEDAPGVAYAIPAHDGSATDSPATDAPATDSPATDDEVIIATPVEDSTAIAPVIAHNPQPVTPPQQVLYVQVPDAPRRKGNRVAGAAIAAASGILFAAVLALATAFVGLVVNGRLSFALLGDPQFYIPVLFFVIAFVILVLLANRANWWAYILGSVVVAVVVYFGSIGLGLLSTGIILNTPEEASVRYTAALTNPFIVISALLAREVSLWAGSLIARRGRKIRERNAEARQSWEREVAEKRAAHESGATAAPVAG